MTMPFLSLPKKREQYADRVHAAVWTDQWGREWAGNKDKKTLHPSSQILPEGWASPHVALIPPPQYHVFNKRDNGKFKIDTTRWRRDQEGARQEWRKQFGELARGVYKDKSVEAIRELSATILELVGPMPIAGVWIEAMEANNRWVLGIPNRRGEMDPRPAWVDELMEGTHCTPWDTLQRVEFYEGAVGSIAPADVKKYGNPDDDEADEEFVPAAARHNDDIVARMAGQLDRQDVQDHYQPETQPMREPVRGKGGQFTKKS